MVWEGGNEATWGVVRDHSGGSTSSPSSRASRGGGTGTGLLDWLEPDEDEDEVRGGWEIQ